MSAPHRKTPVDKHTLTISAMVTRNLISYHLIQNYNFRNSKAQLGSLDNTVCGPWCRWDWLQGRGLWGAEPGGGGGRQLVGGGERGEEHDLPGVGGGRGQYDGRGD